MMNIGNVIKKYRKELGYAGRNGKTSGSNHSGGE